MPTDPLLEKARAALDSDNESLARDCALRAAGQEVRSAALCAAWAEVCMEAGPAKAAREFYEKALRLSPDHPEALFGLASLLGETGHAEKSIRHLKKLLKLQPGHTGARSLLAEYYRDLGLPGQAEALGGALTTGSSPSPSPLRTFSPSVGRRDTQRLQSLFAGRETGFAVQEISPETGESSFVFRDGPLPHELLAAHILGEVNVGFYPLRADHTVGHAMLSARIAGGMSLGRGRSGADRLLFEEKLRHHCSQLTHHATLMGHPAYAELTAMGGGRIWFFFDGFIHFLKARQFLKDFLAHAPTAESPLVIEPALPTRPVGIGWAEHAIPMPLGLDRSTLRRSFFLDGEGNVDGEQLKLIHRIRRNALSSLHAPRGGWSLTPGADAPTRAAQRHRGFKRLVEGCSVVAELARWAATGRGLRREEKVILFHTMGRLEDGASLLHECLHTCPDYQYESVHRQATRLKGNPMSCVKIRELVPELTSSLPCHCGFDLRGGKYPSPLLHVHPDMVPASEFFATPEDLSLKEAARRYAALLHHREEAMRAMGRLEKVLEKAFKEKSIARIRLDRLELVRREADGVASWKMEYV